MSVLEPSPDAVAGKRGRISVVNALARLLPGVTPQQAEAEGTAAARSTIRPMAANLLFGVGGPPLVHARPVIDEMTSRVRPALMVLGAGVVCVLLIACANVANLFLARGVVRQREVTVRAAIGASRGRLVRQLLTESAVFSAIGGGLGLALAAVLVRLAPLLASNDFPRLDDIAIDGATIACAAVAAVATAIVAGLAPALRSARVDLVESLRGGDGATAGGFRGRSGSRLRDGLLVAEAAFAVLLLVGAALLARSFVRLTHVDAGYTAAAGPDRRSLYAAAHYGGARGDVGSDRQVHCRAGARDTGRDRGRRRQHDAARQDDDAVGVSIALDATER